MRERVSFRSDQFDLVMIRNSPILEKGLCQIFLNIQLKKAIK